MAILLLAGIGSAVLASCSTPIVAVSPGVLQECAAVKSGLSGRGDLQPQLAQRLENIVTGEIKQGLHPKSLVATAIQVLLDRGDEAERNLAVEMAKTFGVNTAENSAYTLFGQTIAECDIPVSASGASSLEQKLSISAETKLLAELPRDISKISCRSVTIFNPVDPLAEAAVECSAGPLPLSVSAQPTSPQWAVTVPMEIWYLAYPDYSEAAVEFNKLSTQSAKAGGTTTSERILSFWRIGIVMQEGALMAECSGALSKMNPAGIAWIDPSYNSVGLAVQCLPDAQSASDLAAEFTNGDFDLG